MVQSTLNHYSHRLNALLNANSVAVVGASSDPSKITGRPIAYMLEQGYCGNIYPVNPNHKEIQGLTCYASLKSINKTVDLAIIGTAASKVEEIVREGIAYGIKAFIIFSSGFAEFGKEGHDMQQRLSQLAHEYQVVIVGPNCLGVANSNTGLMATFTTALEKHTLQKGRFSFISQSGALGAYWMDIVLGNGIGFSHWITTGNECNVDAAEAIDFLITDPNTDVIGLYLEDIRRTPAFRNALDRAARANKPVIIIKAGSSSIGAAAAASHTGALAGDDALYDACFKQYGAIRVQSLTEMMDTAKLLLNNATPLGSKLAVMTVSGGAGVLIADACEFYNIKLPTLKTKTADSLASVLPSFVVPNNPLDLTGNVLQNTKMISSALHCLAADGDTHAIVFFIGMMHSIADVFVEALTESRKQVNCPIIVIWVGALDSSIQTLQSYGITVFLDIPQATAAMSRCLNAATTQKKIKSRPTINLGSSIIEDIPNAPQLSEWEGKKLLSQQNSIQLLNHWLIKEKENLPTNLIYPLAAKLQSPELLHKSDSGAVILQIKNKEALCAALEHLFSLGRQLKLQVQGVLVEPMLAFDHELLLGLRRDPNFGPTLTLARGGVEAELDPDVVNILLPATEADIFQLIQRLRCAKLFEGYRGKPGADIAKIAKKIADLCAWFEQHNLREVEINPLAIRGEKIWALDALITPLKVTE